MYKINEFNERYITNGDTEVIEIERGKVYRISGAFGDTAHFFYPEEEKVTKAFSGAEVPPVTRTGHRNSEFVAIREIALDAIYYFEAEADIAAPDIVSTVEMTVEGGVFRYSSAEKGLIKFVGLGGDVALIDPQKLVAFLMEI